MDTTQTSEQLTLLPPAPVPLRFRLDSETRRRGLQHVAELKQLLAERQAARTDREQAESPRVRLRGRAA